MPKGVYDRSKSKPRSNSNINKEAKVIRDAASGPKPLALMIEVPAEGLQLKMTANGIVTGTLIIYKNGFKYVPSNGKRPPDRDISWDLLAKLFSSGIL